MSETTRVADQLHRAFEGHAWHGDSLLKILSGVTAEQAATHPIPNAHSIWELVLHIAAWDGAVVRRLAGESGGVSKARNFPVITDTSEGAWHSALDRLQQVHRELVATVAAFPDSRLNRRVSGKKPAHHTYYYMLHGVVQHELYHAGQIALLKKALESDCQED